MISDVAFFGRAKELTISSNSYIYPFEARVYTIISNTTNNLKLFLPVANLDYMRAGGPVFYVWNKSTTNTVLVHNSVDSYIGTLSAGEVGVIALARLSAAGTWFFKKTAKKT